MFFSSMYGLCLQEVIYHKQVSAARTSSVTSDTHKDS